MRGLSVINVIILTSITDGFTLSNPKLHTSRLLSTAPTTPAEAISFLNANIANAPTTPPQLKPTLTYFINEYVNACTKGKSSPGEIVASFSKCISLAMKHGMGPDKYTFGVDHTAIRAPYDYYKFGVDFFRPCVDISNSVLNGQENLQKAIAQTQAGENVIFLANHQSEADPQCVSLMFELAGFGREAEQIHYVAGHKVTTDPLAIPFSLGRNLICIHSKKHIDVDPELKGEKQKQNVRAMGRMLEVMKSGGGMIWVAPSGGRDRRDVKSGEVPIAEFDGKTLDMFRLMARKSKVATHFYPMSMATYDLCPPPDETVSGTGEERNVRFGSIGLCVGEEVVNEGGLDKRHDFLELAMERVEGDYNRLRKELK